MNEQVGRHTHLFQQVNFKSHSGLDLTWKIEMDALAKEEWECIAKMIYELEPRSFREVVGIPRGGLKLSEPLSQYATGKDEDPLLIVDDVMTTGGSMEYFLDQYFRNRHPCNYFGWVAFSRCQTPHWVHPLFQMPYKDENNKLITMIGMKSIYD
tara:strand:- start:10151 stop:10612 length:462 start_codon:yes stop_codon:yes gene_type:complete